MIPVSLVIKGLYSYQEEHTVDFTRLMESRLFGIFGSVGSGKSSILEAITFALYNNTERLSNSAADNRNYNMMNLRSNELLIDFIFKKDVDSDKEYRFTVKGKRSKDESVKKYDRSSYSRNGTGEWEPLPYKTADEILNLEYDDFRRTVIIPQGKFKEFLELGNKDRTEMLKRLFNLEKFELYKKTSILKGRNNTAIEVVKTKLFEVESITPETIADIKSRLAETKAQIDALQETIVLKELELKHQQLLKELFEKLAEKTRSVSELEVKKPLYAEREKQIDEYQACLIKFKPLIDDINNRTAEIAAHKKDLDSRRELFSRKKELLDKEEKHFTEIKKDYENRSSFEKQLDELGRIKEIRRCEKEIEALLVRIENGRKFVHDTESQIESLKTQKSGLEEDYDKLATELEALKDVHEVSEWFLKKNNINKQLEKASSAYNKFLKDYEQEDIKKIKYLEEKGSSVFTNGEAKLADDDILHYIAGLKEQLNEKLASINEKLDMLKQQRSLQEYAGALEDGKPCPLCGSFEHPSPLTAHNIGDELEAANQEYRKTETDIKICDTLISNINIFSATKEKIREQIEAQSRDLEECRQSLEDLKKEFKWKNYHYDREDKVREDIEKKNRLQESQQKLAAQRTDLDRKLESTRQQKEKYDKVLAGLVQNHESVKSQKDTYNSQLTTLSYDEFTAVSDEMLDGKVRSLKEKLENIISEYESAEPKINSLRNEISSLSGQIQELDKQVNAKSEQLEVRISEIGILMQEAGYSDRKELEQILSQKINIEAERKKINDFYLALKTEQAQLNLLKNEAEGKSYDKETHESMVSSLNHDKSELSNLNQVSGALTKELKDTETKLERKKELRKDLEQLEKRGANLDVMLNLFRGSGFVNYVSTQYLRNLVQAANDRFMKLTNNQFHLVLKETADKSDNTFEVCDHLNGGKLRHVKTLSGGQTFQASLSLALALSENISIFNKAKLNFFFLDEGFGTLDRDSLHIVFDTLKSLRKENRIVGVISHVEDLQQEIENFIVARIHPERGTLLTASWE